MQLIRNPVIGWNTLPREYSAGSISNSSSTAGVIHPPHGLLRGKPCLSRIVTSMPECRNFQAQEEPAGPPPTIRMSHESIAIPVLHSARLRGACRLLLRLEIDRKSTRLNSSHGYISYAVFCLQKK